MSVQTEPFGTGANGAFSLASLSHAAAGCASVPPAGPHVSVEWCQGAPPVG